MAPRTAFLHRNLPGLLLRARESVMAHTRPSLRTHNLSDQQWRVLRVLAEHGRMETGRIAREAHLLGPSLTGVLARMERDGLVRRERDAEDQRRTVVEATALGQRLAGELARTFEAHYAWLEQALSQDKLAQLYRLLDEVIELERPRPAGRRAEAKGARPERTDGVPA
ncbi:MAG: Homoprotocatechuate degradative operon repressor [Burkholderiaceae bacterium]|jgi:homoprotocatechuate degradation regulator HpaR|nr:MAG: Homoprotocatechuate degradative operon repressor [Burkholderiaceae bacterium]